MYDSGSSSWNDPTYVGSDLIGTKRLATDESASQTERLVYTAFGERVSSTASVDRYGYAGAWGYERPDVTDALEPWGWLHVGARYYDPCVGRFMQRDPIGIRGGLNVYLYAKNNPILLVDPTGNATWIDWGVGIGAAIGAGIAIEIMSHLYYDPIEEKMTEIVEESGALIALKEDIMQRGADMTWEGNRPYRVHAENLRPGCSKMFYMFLPDGRISVTATQNGEPVQSYPKAGWRDRNLDVRFVYPMY